MNNELTVTTPAQSKSPVVITNTWDGVRHWLNAAKMFEQGKLFSQVMTGFELMALHKAHGTNQGARRDLCDTTSPQNGGKLDWPELVKKEAGLSEETARRYMLMAKAAAPRLKKLPLLKNFDPFTTPMSQLSEPQQQGMEKAVKKLTDGQTQADFFAKLYKGRPGNPNAKGGRPGKRSSEEEAAEIKAMALEHSGAIGSLLHMSNADFFLLEDLEVNCQIAEMKFALELRRAWLDLPTAKRDATVITKMINERKS